MADPDPGSGAFFTPGSGMGNESRSGSKMNIRELRNNFWVKILKFLDAECGCGSGNLFDPGSGMRKIRIRDP